MLLNSRNFCLILPLFLLGCGGGSGEGSGNKTPEPVNYTVSAVAGTGGSITPASKSVRSGQTTSFTLQPDAGFAIASASGCGGQLNAAVYTTAPVLANCQVNASFTPLQYQVATVVEGSGTVMPQSLTLGVKELRVRP